MNQDQPNNPLHGVTLQAILEDLVERYGFPGLAQAIPVRCFLNDPSIASSLKFLRKTPWARAKVEQIWVQDHRRLERKRKRNQLRAAQRATKAQHQADGSGEPTTDG